MARLMPDQAEGLRRLFVADARRMVALVSGGDRLRDSSLLAYLTAVLAGQGGKVLLLDEALVAGQCHAAFGAQPKHDLDKVLSGHLDIADALVPTPFGVDLLAGGERSALQPRPRMEARIGLVNAFYRLAGKYDIILVHAAASELSGSHPSFVLACQDIIMSCSDQPDSMPDVYGRIKVLHQAGERRFHLLFDGVDEAVAQARFRRIAEVSRRHLQLMPGYLGTMPAGERQPEEFFIRLADQIQAWPLPDSQTGHFPELMRRLLGGRTPAVRAL